MGQEHLYIVRRADLGKIFLNFRNNPMVLLISSDAMVECSSNSKLLPNVNPKCFCDDAWETLLLKRKGGWQTLVWFLWFSRKNYWACLLRSRLKRIFHWKAHCFILARSVLSFDVIITDSWIIGKRAVSSAKSLVLNNKPSAKSFIYIYILAIIMDLEEHLP